MAERKQSVDRLKQIFYRWLDLIALSITAILIYLVLARGVALISARLSDLLIHYHWAILFGIALFAIAVLWFILGKLSGVSFPCLWTKEIFFNPPVWLFGVISFTLLCEQTEEYGYVERLFV